MPVGLNFDAYQEQQLRSRFEQLMRLLSAKGKARLYDLLGGMLRAQEELRVRR